MESMQSIIDSPRQPLLRNTFVSAVVLSVLVAIVDSMLVRSGSDLGLLRLAVMGAINVAVVWLLAESWMPTLRTLAMFAGGAALGACYFTFNYAHEQIHIAASGPLDYVNYFASAVLIAPVFEEAIVRRWMFFGAAEWIGWRASALLVSALFALTHSAIPLFAFVFSLGMCFLAWRGVKTVDRAAFHGSHNLILQGLFVFYGT